MPTVPAGAIQSFAGFTDYFVAMAQEGWWPLLCLGLRPRWEDTHEQELQDSYGQQWVRAAPIWPYTAPIQPHMSSYGPYTAPCGHIWPLNAPPWPPYGPYRAPHSPIWPLYGPIQPLYSSIWLHTAP